MLVPPLLNAPLNDISEDRALVEFTLRMNATLDFLENDKFDQDKIVYDENYQNSVAHSPTFMGHLDDVCKLITDNFDKSTSVMEVGCGKGDFFNVLDKQGYEDLVGYDTAYDGDNEKIQKRYLNIDDKTQADLVILRHALEHIPQPYSFLQNIKKINGSKGYIYIEVPDLAWIRDNNAFYDVAYEHVNYFTLKSLSSMFGDKYLSKGTLFGGQYIYVIAKIEDLCEDFNAAYNDSENWEYLSFNDLFPKFERTLQEIESKITDKRSVFLWGGAGKAGTFLHHCSVQSPAIMEKLVFAVDINPKKVDKYLPSSLVRIASSDEFFSQAENNDFLMIANPIYTDEIMAELTKHGLADIETYPL